MFDLPAGSIVSGAAPPTAPAPAADPLGAFLERHGRWIQWLTVVAFVFLASTLVWARWWSGRSAHLGFAGFLPVSDALGYYRCAVVANEPELSARVGIPTDWCARRALYPLALQTLLWMSGWHASIALLLQAGLIGVAIAMIAGIVLRVNGVVVAAL